MVRPKNKEVKKKITYHEIFRKYLEGEIKLELWQKVGILLLVVIIAGTIGWLWEFSLNEIAGGFQELYVKGGNLLPWISLYAYGAILVILTTYRIRQKPILVFFVSALVTGVLELISGFLVYIVGNGTRYWNYLDDWWGVGSINGFVCPASVMAFGIGSLFLMYAVLPFCIYLAKKMHKQKFLTFVLVLFTLIMIDDITNLVLKNNDLPTAVDFYVSLGFKYK